jgi:hypothetical protein
MEGGFWEEISMDDAFSTNYLFFFASFGDFGFLSLFIFYR